MYGDDYPFCEYVNGFVVKVRNPRYYLQERKLTLNP